MVVLICISLLMGDVEHLHVPFGRLDVFFGKMAIRVSCPSRNTDQALLTPEKEESHAPLAERLPSECGSQTEAALGVVAAHLWWALGTQGGLPCRPCQSKARIPLGNIVDEGGCAPGPTCTLTEG